MRPLGWEPIAVDEDAAVRLATQLKIRPLTARILVGRGIVEVERAGRFLAPRLADLRPPAGMADLDKALDRIVAALAAGETIGVFGDYDVDGVTTAAVLTIIGFSMNDTIVVFDRIRENAARLRDRKFDRVVNQSINETLSRTILTSATVFFVTLAMNVFGVGVIRDFAFAMNVGVVVGTYSSIFIASPILIWLNEKFLASQKQVQVRGRRGKADELEV